MAYETIIVEVEDHIAKVTLNRPDALNAINDQLMTELADAMAAAQTDSKVRCIVLTGSEKAFAAGADIAMMKDKTYVEVFTEDLFGPEIDTINRVRKPIIAAVSGYALGGGCELAMMCDFIIASETAKFGQPEVNLGVMAGIGGTQRLTKAVGKAKAMDMNLTGRFMDAAEAEDGEGAHRGRQRRHEWLDRGMPTGDIGQESDEEPAHEGHADAPGAHAEDQGEAGRC